MTVLFKESKKCPTIKASKNVAPSTSCSMQSNLYPEDPFFGYWNDLDGGPPPGFGLPPHHPMHGSPFENGTFGFVPPPPASIALPCPVEPPMCPPIPCHPPGPMGPMHRHFPRYPPATLAPLQAMIPGPGPPGPPPLLGQVTHHFASFPQPQHVLPPAPVPLPIPLDHGLERSQLNDMGQMEQVVVKNGQVFHISFLDDTGESEQPLAELPTPSASDDGESEERDWINYDELPLLQNVTGGATENGSFKCGYCPKELKTALNLYVHEQTHKTDRLDCKTCGKRFNRIGKLEHHIAQHHPEVVADEAGTPLSPSGTPALNDFSNYCVECEEFFTSEEELQNHMEQNHRLIDELKSPKEARKSIGCPFCFETFEWPCLLKTHMTKHTGEKPFICERCNVSFRFVQSFYRHNRRVHGREK